MRIEILRWYRDLATYGDGSVINDDNEVIFKFKTLELPWKDNKRGISCVPEDEYDAVKEGPTLTRPYIYFRVPNVPGRSGILWHPGTYTKDIKGCTLPGEKLLHINEDGILDVTNTKITLKKLVDLLPDRFKIIIKKAP